MSLKKKLILSVVSVSAVLAVATVGIFLLLSSIHLKDSVEEEYERVFRTYKFILKTSAQSYSEVSFPIKDCKPKRADFFSTLTTEGIVVGRVRDCRFYGTYLHRVIDLTSGLQDLRWLILYDRDVLERITEKQPEFMDRFIRNRLLMDNFVLEGSYDPELLGYLNNFSGYTLVKNYSLLIMDFPLTVYPSVPIGRLIFVKDFSAELKDVLFTPVVFMVYTILLVTVLSAILFILFNRIVKDIYMLRHMAYKFKELDFSDIQKLSDHLRKEKTRDEMFYLKRSILTMAQELESLINQLQGEKEKLEEIAYTDPLTGLYNRRFFFEEAKKLYELAKRHNEPFSIIMMDVDNFKRVNDEYGHDVGDMVLKKLAEVIKNSVRASDIAARFGGEEFIIALPKTDEEGAVLVAERIRQEFKKSKVVVDSLEVRTTVSVGVSTYRGDQTLDQLIKEADEALYRAKKTGKDKVVTYTEIAQETG